MPKTFIPPKKAQQNAKQALEVRAKKPASQRGMTPVGLARARDLSNGKSLSLNTIKRMKAYFDRHEVDKKGETWGEQGKGWQAWMGWGGDEGQAWVERILSGATIRKVALVDMMPSKLKAMRGDELRLAWLRLNQWYDTARQNKSAIEDFVNAAKWVISEFERRGYNIDNKLPLAVEAGKLSKSLIEARFDNLPNEMVVINDFISVVGSTVKGKENPGDLDVLIRAEIDCDTNMLIKAENAWLQVRKALNPDQRHEMQYIYNAQGSHDDYIPMYDLVLRRRPVPETKLVKACSEHKIDDFIRNQRFELACDHYSDKGPAVGTVLDAFDDKIVVEFDEPQTFSLDDIKSALKRTDQGWLVKAQPSIQSVHVPSTNWEHDEQKPIRINLGCGQHKKPGYTGIDIDKKVRPDLVHDLSLGIPYKDDSIDDIYASHFLEHCSDPNQIMSEIHRVLKPGGILEFEVPSTSGEGAFAHPDHKSYWNKSSFSFWTQDELLDDRPKFELVELEEEVLSDEKSYVRGKLQKPNSIRKTLAPFKPFQPPKPELAGTTEIFTVSELWKWAQDKVPVGVEPKWNGFRVIGERSGDKLRLWTEGKSKDNMLDKLPQLRTALEKIPGSWVIDADLAIEKGGKRLPRPDLMKLNRDNITFDEGEKPVLTVFDMPYHEKDLSDLPFEGRRKHLESMKFFNEFIKLSPIKWAKDKKQLKAAIDWGVKYDRSEGVVAKEGSSKYPKGATNAWSKYKRAVELKVQVLGVKPAKGGGHNYLGGLAQSQDDDWENVADGMVELGWSFTSDISAKKDDIITVSVLELVPDEETNKLTWLGATVLDVDNSRKTPYTTEQSIDIAERGGVLQKMLDINGMDTCYFCDHEPEKIIIWGGGNRTLYICSGHVAEGVEHTINVNRDKVNEVLDINESKEYNVQTPNGISINVNISKQLGNEGDITRESVATQFWDNNWDKLYPKSGSGKFVYQHHWRGLSEEETNLSDKELMNTSHSVHGDLRLEAGNELWGFSAFIGTTADNRRVGGDKIINATDSTKVRGTFKLAQPKAWLNVGVKKPYVTEPGGVGSTSQKYALFEALDHGAYELGVRNRHYVEIFLKGGKLKGRFTIMSIPVEGGRAWILSKPKDQTPYAESHNLEDEIKRLKKEGHKKLLWTKPGEVPKVIDLTGSVEKALDVKLLKSLDEEKRLVMGIALEPDMIDAHNDTVSAEEIEKAAHEYLRKSRVVGEQHRKKAGAEIVESYIAPVDMTINNEVIRKGSWVVTVKVLSDKLWSDVKAGKFTGFSIGGYGKRIAAH